MKKTIVILFTVFTVNSSMADISALPTYEQAQKLVAAAWKSPPRSIDVTYYLAVKDKKKTEEHFRKIYKEHFDNEYGPDEELSADMLERKEGKIQENVDYGLAQQKKREKIKYRIRYDGKSCRVDRVYGSPEKILDANTPLETTLIETPAPTVGLELYRYSHNNKSATVEKRERSPITVINNQLNSIVMIPNAVILQMKLGTRKDDLVTEPYDVNETKIKQLCSGTLENFTVKIRPDENEPNAKDRIEISLYLDDKIEAFTSLMICAKDDYSKVYYFEDLNSITNKSPIFTRTCSDFDTQGIPHHVTQIQNNGKGDVILHEIYRIENVRVNISIPKEVFEFNPPEDYVVTDYRLPETERQAVKIEGLKRQLKGKDRGRKFQAFLKLREYFKDNPSEMREIAASMLEDEHSGVRRLAFHTLIQVLKDDLEELKRIAVIMQDDEDRLVRKMAARVLQRIESEDEKP